VRRGLLGGLGRVSSSRAELVAFDDVQDWKVKALSWLRDGRIVRRPAR
jgi:hypothetical protein